MCKESSEAWGAAGGIRNRSRAGKNTGIRRIAHGSEAGLTLRRDGGNVWEWNGDGSLAQSSAFP